jgi:hypothetical protein
MLLGVETILSASCVYNVTEVCQVLYQSGTIRHLVPSILHTGILDLRSNFLKGQMQKWTWILKHKDQLSSRQTLTKEWSRSWLAVHLSFGSLSRQWARKPFPSGLSLSGTGGLCPIPTLYMIWKLCSYSCHGLYENRKSGLVSHDKKMSQMLKLSIRGQ